MWENNKIGQFGLVKLCLFCTRPVHYLKHLHPKFIMGKTKKDEGVGIS